MPPPTNCRSQRERKLRAPAAQVGDVITRVLRNLIQQPGEAKAALQAACLGGGQEVVSVGFQRVPVPTALAMMEVQGETDTEEDEHVEVESNSSVAGTDVMDEEMALLDAEDPVEGAAHGAEGSEQTMLVTLYLPGYLPSSMICSCPG